ncbi:hypothetical protein L249_0919 [Ophiocordyceps polyrhachis-furcata BCC 54312]|uniref:Uncharacterized protein n=1 Tax=Ophiocordyceps polyrhachis-furcata BCC 54312 TaxID=1330021 RepID=A0A367LF80_9HYPO|nr:hypothetical protein L249_0919 [Ophiocordyceps polyrhachis-furcata BCC 54312]
MAGEGDEKRNRGPIYYQRARYLMAKDADLSNCEHRKEDSDIFSQARDSESRTTRWRLDMVEEKT